MSQSEDILLIAEKLASLTEQVGTLTNQVAVTPVELAEKTLGASVKSLEAALAGIQSLDRHILSNDLGALSKRVDEAGDQFQTALAALDNELANQVAAASKRDADLGKQVDAVKADLGKIEEVRHAFAKRQDDTKSEFAKQVADLAAALEKAKTEFADPKTLNPRGPWVMGETYNRLDLVSVAGTSYLCLYDGTTTKPSPRSKKWMVLAARGGGGSGGPLTSLAINMADIDYAATIDLTLNDEVNYRSVDLTGNLTITASGYQAGRILTLRIVSDSSARTLTFPSGWVFVGGEPTATTASKTSILSLACFGSAEADVVAAFAEEY